MSESEQISRVGLPIPHWQIKYDFFFFWLNFNSKLTNLGLSMIIFYTLVFLETMVFFDFVLFCFDAIFCVSCYVLNFCDFSVFFTSWKTYTLYKAHWYITNSHYNKDFLLKHRLQSVSPDQKIWCMVPDSTVVTKELTSSRFGLSWKLWNGPFILNYMLTLHSAFILIYTFKLILWKRIVILLLFINNINHKLCLSN